MALLISVHSLTRGDKEQWNAEFGQFYDVMVTSDDARHVYTFEEMNICRADRTAVHAICEEEGDETRLVPWKLVRFLSILRDWVSFAYDQEYMFTNMEVTCGYKSAWMTVYAKPGRRQFFTLGGGGDLFLRGRVWEQLMGARDEWKEIQVAEKVQCNHDHNRLGAIAYRYWRPTDAASEPDYSPHRAAMSDTGAFNLSGQL